MALDGKQRDGAGDSCWRPLLQRSIHLMGRGEHAQASDLLRVLVLAAPREIAVWDALAECHEAQAQIDVAESLRSLGRLIHDQFTSVSSQ